MPIVKHWNALLKNHRNPCFVVDITTNEVLFLNPAMDKLLDGRQNVVGEKFYHIIPCNNPLGETECSLNWDLQDFHEYKIYDSTLKKKFIVTHSKVNVGGKDFDLNLYAPNQQEHDEHNFEDTMTRCISVLQNENKFDALLQILGEFYDADKAYLYLVQRSDMKIPCKASWRKNEDIVVTPDLSDKMDAKVLLDWFETRNEMGIIEAAKIHSSFCEKSVEAQVLNAFNLKNIVMCVVEDQNKEALGMVIVSNRENVTADYRLLQAVAQFMERDISKSEMQSTLQQLNETDLLTGFYSRSIYSQKVDSLRQNPPKTLGIAFANVNGVKKINSEFGLAKGDSYIKKAAQMIQNHFDADFYRISGDEFIAFFPDVDKDTFESQIIALQEKLKSDEYNFFALGHAWHGGRIDTEELIKIADTVMYINKQEYYHSSERSFQDITDTTLSDLLSYLANDEFMIYLQPQVLLKDGSLYGAEALIRRFDKTNQKMVFPDQFISLYEKKSVIRHVDIFVVEQVCKLLVEWEKIGKAIPISVNLSRVTLQEYGIVDTIARICDRFHVNRQLLVIEVTERVGLIENNVASSLIMDFKDRGFKISLDDFGCAYSNIVTLAQIEVDEVKLDKSLVDYLTTNDKNYVLVKNVLAMCNELKGTSTLAEGIEDEKQATTLHELGCHLGQGYFYSRPIPVDEFVEKYIK